jgi:hypothetical protein
VRILLALLLALPALGQSQQNWTTTNTVLEVIYASATTLDWASTLNIEKYNREHQLPSSENVYNAGGNYVYTLHHAEYEEHNHIMGRHPTRATINQYFSAVLVGHLAISIALPQRARVPFQTIMLLVSLDAVNGNKKVGLRFTF